MQHYYRGPPNTITASYEVQGYILISKVAARRISLPKLRIIWGDASFRPYAFSALNGSYLDKDPEGALYVFDNPGLVEVDLTNLREIARHDVVVNHNPYLCYWQTIDWYQIFGPTHADRVHIIDSFSKCNRSKQDLPCGHGCQNSNNCWGTDISSLLEFKCQKIYRTNCAPQCSAGTCFKGDGSPTSCCHHACLGGCTGPTNSDCIACRGYWNDGQCVNECPKPQIYDPMKGEMVTNQDGKFAYLRQCLKKCPNNMMIDPFAGACVASCRETFRENPDTRSCEPCPNNHCMEKRCKLTGDLLSSDVDSMENCTLIDGNLVIVTKLFKEYPSFDPTIEPLALLEQLVNSGALTKLEPVNMTLFRNALFNVRRVTGYVRIQIDTTNMKGMKEYPKNLDFLPNLEEIEGRVLHANRVALYINFTPFKWIDLSSLRKIHKGEIAFNNNENLCYVQKIPWNEIRAQPGIFNGTLINITKSVQECAAEGMSCDPLCNVSKGCWGPGPRLCYECQHWDLDGECVGTCNRDQGLFIKIGKTCERCDPECKTCFGPGPEDCGACLNVKEGNRCVSECPEGKYPDQDNMCQFCSPKCHQKRCTGPGEFVGAGGCDRCEFGYRSSDGKILCLDDLSNDRNCSRYANLTDYYIALPEELGLEDKVVRKVCRRCEPMCSSCLSFGRSRQDHDCVCRFKYEKRRDECVASCPKSTFETKSLPNVCFPCHEECASCYGSSDNECSQCKNRKITFDLDEPVFSNTTKFRCVKECPPEKPFPDQNYICRNVDIAAVEIRQHRNKQIIIGVVLGFVFFGLVVVSICAFAWRKKARNGWRWDKEPYPLPPYDPNPDAKPNMAQIQTISESALRKGPLLGAGAFGSVYKGLFLPEGSSVKIPIAIKILQDSSSQNVQEDMINEAANMASMNHVHLVRLIGICVSKPIMLVTPFMPLGNLLEFVHKYKSRIDSEHMLKWCCQIASGMEYLEQNRMVHRDLAARNVLVKNPSHVKISDFGLAKMLDVGQEEYVPSSEKMPVKWLALECIRYRRYTHKSDTWAYGVTVWEIITFGERPYQNVKPNDIVDILEQGERLPQPLTCTLEVYMLLIKCWMVDADRRPTFTELRTAFERFHQDPDRYLVIETDPSRRFPRFPHLSPDQPPMAKGSPPCPLDSESERHESCATSNNNDDTTNTTSLCCSTALGSDPFAGTDEDPALWDFDDLDSVGAMLGHGQCDTPQGQPGDGTCQRRWLTAEEYLDTFGQPSDGVTNGPDDVRLRQSCNQRSGRNERRNGRAKSSTSGSRRYQPEPVKLTSEVVPSTVSDDNNYLIPKLSGRANDGQASTSTQPATNNAGSPGQDSSYNPYAKYVNDVYPTSFSTASTAPASARIIEGTGFNIPSTDNNAPPPVLHSMTTSLDTSVVSGPVTTALTSSYGSSTLTPVSPQIRSQLLARAIDNPEYLQADEQYSADKDDNNNDKPTCNENNKTCSMKDNNNSKTGSFERDFPGAVSNGNLNLSNRIPK